jgi:uncharacterized protein (TIGR03435 family)
MHRYLIAVASLATLVYGQTPERLTFEVASIKVSNPDTRGGGIRPLAGGQTYKAEGVTVKLIFSLMYKIPMLKISGGPAWFETDRWDIDAKAAKPSNIDDLHTMFQNLLADEFKLKFHKDVKEGPVYALMVDKNGPKMAVNETEQDFKIPITPTGPGKVKGVRVPMSYLCYFLGLDPLMDRPIIDKTGLDGQYDFTLAFLPELPPGFKTETLPPEMLELPSLFDALRQQLGLRLEPQKGPVEFYAIDHLEKPAVN